MTPVDRYTCEEAFRRLDDYLDRALSGVEMQLVREHLETCAACSREFQFEAEVIQSIREKLRRLDAPPDLLARIRSALGGAMDQADGTP